MNLARKVLDAKVVGRRLDLLGMKWGVGEGRGE